MPSKMLHYVVINEHAYPGQGHIINIAKRHTNRRWRQYTPEKQCIIELELKKLCNIDSIQLKGFGTYIVEITFKDINNQIVTKLKYNFDFFDESINEKIICEKEVKFVSVRLQNSKQSPKRMGLNHFFMRGQVIKKDDQQSDQEQVKKRKKQPSQIWVRQKVQGQDKWGLDNLDDQNGQDDQNEEVKDKTKAQNSTPKRRGKSKKPQAIALQQKQTEIKINGAKRQQPVKAQSQKIDQISKSKKKMKQDNVQIKVETTKIQLEQHSKSSLDIVSKIPLQLQKSDNKGGNKGSFSQKFQQKYKINKDKKNQNLANKESQFSSIRLGTQTEQSQTIETQEQKKQRIKRQLIEKLMKNKSNKKTSAQQPNQISQN